MVLVTSDRLLHPRTGWSGQTIFRLENGESWQQAVYRCGDPGNSRPRVRIWRKGGLFWLEIEGRKDLLRVSRVYEK